MIDYVSVAHETDMQSYKNYSILPYFDTCAHEV